VRTLRSAHPPPANLVSWWDGDAVDGSTAIDIEDSNDGTLNGGVALVGGKVGQAFEFDGMDDFIEVPTAANIEVENGDLTIDMWVKLTGPDTAQYDLIDKLLSPGVGSEFASGFILHTLIATTGGAGITRFCFANTSIGGRRCYDATTNIVDEQFHHVAAVKSGLDVKIYVDGQDDNAVLDHSLAHSVEDPVSMLIGKRHLNIAFFKGIIDEVEIFDRALSASEIQAVFNASSAGKCKFPICSSTIGTIDGLRAEVDALNTSVRTINALNKQLDKAQAALDDGNNKTARSDLDNFIGQVVRRSNSKETDSNRVLLDEANNLICAAANVLLGIPIP